MTPTAVECEVGCSADFTTLVLKASCKGESKVLQIFISKMKSTYEPAVFKSDPFCPIVSPHTTISADVAVPTCAAHNGGGGE